MARRLIAQSRRAVNAHPDAHLYPSVVNTRVTVPDTGAPLPARIPDREFNTRPSRYRVFMSGGALSQFILREGFERPVIRVPVSPTPAVVRGQMLAVRNPDGNMETPTYKAWGTILDSYAKGHIT